MSHTLTIACPNCGDAHACPALAPKRRPAKPKETTDG